MSLRRALAALLAIALVLPLGGVAQTAQPKVLRVAFNIAETGFDPARLVDLYSRIVTAHIFEAPYAYDHLARPAKIKPLTAAGMPEHSDDFRTWTVRIRPGIYFADDPAFKGKKRELVAEDYVYQLKRIVDPANKSPVVASALDYKAIGLAALREAALRDNKPFDYDTPIEGVRALDRYTLQYKLADPRPRFIYDLVVGDLLGAVAREVVEAYGGDIAAHPVGTGPFRLKQWRRSSLIVLEKNPDYRERFYDAEPAAEDAQGQAMLARLEGRRLPMVDEVHVSIIQESQPRWLAFLNGQIDVISLPAEFVNIAMPLGKVAPNLAKQGISAERVIQPDMTLTYFNMEDPLVGGYTPEKVALRRAISLSIDIEREIQLVFRGQAIPAQSPVVPHSTGYDPAFKSENSEFSVARAKALLDMAGYVDRNGDGWRDQPNGEPLVLRTATQSDQASRQADELRRKNMNAIGIRLEFDVGQWPEQLKKARAGQLMIWSLGSSAYSPDGQGGLARFYGPQAASQNLARFKLPAFDAVYEKMQPLPDGPERDALFDDAKRLTIAYAPYKTHVHRIATTMIHPWVDGYRRPVFWQEWWHMIDLDVNEREGAK